ncbi:CD1247 N-terminal domain-containing protein [Tepidibacillus infernus]|uniref:CD1247 N-terminal domain-containing protein n=1 Tax=Tepidibacillus infernus TaxID=1806172 RepID=UPI003B73E262
MSNIQERIAYLEGLAEGLEMYQNKKEGKFFEEIVGIMTEMNQTLQHFMDRLSELEEYVEAIDEDLNDLEWDFYEDDEDLEDDELEEGIDDELLVMEDDQNEGYYQVECPTCHETVMIDHHLLEHDEPTEVVCPNCNEVIIIDDEDQYIGTNTTL